MFADLNAGDACLDRLELARPFALGLQIERVLVARSAVHPEEDAVLGLGLRVGCRPGGPCSEYAHPPRVREPEHAGRRQLQEVAAGLFRQVIREHGKVPIRLISKLVCRASQRDAAIAYLFKANSDEFNSTHNTSP